MGGFASLALEGRIKFFFFAWEFPDFVKESGGGGIRVQSLKYLKLGLWKFREVQYVVSLGNSQFL